MSKLYPTTEFRIAEWKEEVRRPNTSPSGHTLIGGGSHKTTVTKERLEQKYIDEDCVAIWLPVKRVFVEEYCNKLEEDDAMGSYDFTSELSKL